MSMGIDTSRDVSRSLVQSIQSIELALSTRLRVCTRVSTTRCYIVRQLSDTRESLGQMTGSARLAPVGIRIVAVGADSLNIYICARLINGRTEAPSISMAEQIRQLKLAHTCFARARGSIRCFTQSSIHLPSNEQ